MNRNRTAADLDVHKDSVYFCIMGNDGVDSIGHAQTQPPHIRFRGKLTKGLNHYLPFIWANEDICIKYMKQGKL